MKIVIAVDSFKESMSARRTAVAISKGIINISKTEDIVACPIADGGEGTVDTFLEAIGGIKRQEFVTGPMGTTVEANWALFPEKRLAVIELAQAAGLQLVPKSKRNPMLTTTYGVGELISKALDAKVQKLLIGIGGSATNDGGAGLAQALGAKFGGVGQPVNGGSLREIESIDLSSIDPRIQEIDIGVACDVKNVLIGINGAAQVYGAQKGASAKQIKILDEGLKQLAKYIPEIDPNIPGTGAAGGVGWGLMAFCQAKLHKGIELILKVLNFDKIIEDADLIITGEGRMDNQSLQWKAPFGVAEYASTRDIPVIALCGDHIIDDEVARKHGLQNCYSICKDLNIPAEQAIKDGEKLLEELTEKVIPEWIRFDGN